MPVPMPGHLVVPERYLPPSGKVSHGEKIILRCDNGQLLDIPSTANASAVKDSSIINDIRKIFCIFYQTSPHGTSLSNAPFALDSK